MTAGDRVIQAYLAGKPLSELCVRAAPTIEEEVAEGLRQVIDWLDQGIFAAEIAIVVRQEQLYLQPLADKAAEYDVPLISGRQQSLSQTPLGGLLQALTTAMAQDWDFASTRQLLTQPLLRLPFDPLSQATKLQGQRPRGLAVWDSSLSDLDIPLETDWQDALRRIEAFLRLGGLWETARQEPDINVALSLLVRHLQPKAHDRSPCHREDVLRFLNHVLRSVSLPTLLGKSAVRVINPIGAVGREFRCVLILGLADGIFPVIRRDDPLIDARTRECWRAGGVELPDVTELASVEESLFLLVAGTARDELVCSYPRLDLRMQPLRPSPFLEVICP